LDVFKTNELCPAVALLEPETSIKKEFMLLEMERHGGGGDTQGADGNIPIERWIACMEDLAG